MGYLHVNLGISKTELFQIEHFTKRIERVQQLRTKGSVCWEVVDGTGVIRMGAVP